MERLPTELVIQILEYMSIEELKIIGFTSSEYRSLVIPFLFRRICPWPWGETRRDIPDLIACLRNNRRLSSVVRVLDASDIGNSQQPLEEIRQIMEITAWWEGLILPVADEHIPLAVFDDNTKLRLCRLKFTQETNLAGPKLSHLLLNILPACVNLVVLEIPGLMEDWFKASDPNGSAITIWMNRLEIYRGPPCPLHYLRNGSPLYQLISKAEVPSPMLHSLGRLAGQKLHTLVVRLNLTNMHQNKLIGTNYLPPSPIPSLFPNLQFAAWFLVLPQINSFGEATPDMNGILIDAIRQLHHLRQVWFVSHHAGDTPPEPISAFMKNMQGISLPYLRVFYLWAPNSDPWSYTFRMEEVQSTNEGSYTKWSCETNKSVTPVF